MYIYTVNKKVKKTKYPGSCTPLVSMNDPIYWGAVAGWVMSSVTVCKYLHKYFFVL